MPSSEQKILGDQIVAGISPLLIPIGRTSGSPNRLAANKDIGFIGSYVLGMGFTMSPSEAHELIAEDERNRSVLFPYLNGEDICKSPTFTAPRYVINFFDWTEERARTFSAFRRVERLVRPERQRLKPDGSFATRGQRAISWWKYAEQAKALYNAIAKLNRVVVLPLVSKYSMPAMVETGQVFSHALVVFSSADDFFYGLLTSGIHRAWARSRGSTLETRFRYTPTDCFETFPLPEATNEIREIMRELHEVRSTQMAARLDGITTTYNRFHERTCEEAGITELRRLHAELDRRVVAAYGWRDLDIAYDFRETDEGIRFTFDDAIRVELLNRLLELNQKRYASELTDEQHRPRNGWVAAGRVQES